MQRSRHATFLAGFALCALALPGRALPAGEEPKAVAEAPAAAPAAAPAVAKPAEPAAPRPEGRELNGHLFMPVLAQVTPFATTSFGTYLTLGSGSTTGSVTLDVPNDPNPQTFTGTVDYAAVGGIFGYEVEIVNGVSARFKFSETIYSGTTGKSVLVVGTNAKVGVGVGLTAGLALGDSVRVAAVVDASSAPRFSLLIGPALKDLYQRCSTGLDNCNFDVASLFDQQNVVQIEPGLAASWAPHRSLGVSANVTWVHSSIDNSQTGTATEDGVGMGAAVDFDLRAVTPVPLGLQATWATLVPVSGSTQSAFTDAGGGLFYTGRKDLSLGLQVIVRRFKVTPTLDVSWKTFLSTIGLRYYW